MEAQAQPSVRSRLYRCETYVHNGVTIEVRPLPFHKIPDLLDAIQALWPVFMGEEANIEGLMQPIVALLRECVTIPEDPEFDIGDMPAGIMPELLGIFADQSLDVGKWLGLTKRLRLTVRPDQPEQTQQASTEPLTKSD